MVSGRLRRPSSRRPSTTCSTWSWAAGGTPESVARMVVYVTDKAEYRAPRKEIGEV